MNIFTTGDNNLKKKKENFSLPLLATLAHSVGVVAVAAAPATVPPLASAKPTTAAAAAAKAASRILSARNPGSD